jgi:hypothetical protein
VDAAISAIAELARAGDLPRAGGKRSAARIHETVGQILDTLTRFDRTL